MKRTHHCNALRREHVGHEVTLVGWVDVRRDHGGIQFVDLRDREGLTQILFNNDDADLTAQANRIRPESVIEVTGTVQARGDFAVNPKLPTGEIEVIAKSLVIHNISETPPFPLDEEKAAKVNEDLRLQYRYLDLRRPTMYRNLLMRSKAAKAVRDYMDGQGFLEIETPSLFKSTPEGAREFLVPSRLNPGQFYALNQSPQQYKQMLMVAGIERYYQMARCFRDEDLRADRQPEFTQIDIEMSFIDREDIYATMEGLMKAVWRDVLGVDLPTPFPRMSYFDAMNFYGIDKPDTRFDLKFVDLTELFKNSGFKVFNTIANSKGGAIKALNAKTLADITAGEIRDLENLAKSFGAKGLAYIKVEDNGEWKSPILKFFSDAEKAALKEMLNIEIGDLILFSAADWENCCNVLGRVRLECGKLLVKRGRLELSHTQYNFLWVIEFPLMLHDEEAGRYVAAHHPFTAPVVEDIPLLETNPTAVRGQHYDLVLNGWELGGGSIRIHQPEVQKRVFEDILQIPKDVVAERFGYMLNAFRYGAPPHGGIAFGFDRMIAMMSGAASIREVIAFPKTQKGQDLMAASPTPVTAKQLRDLYIDVVPLETEETK